MPPPQPTYSPHLHEKYIYSIRIHTFPQKNPYIRQLLSDFDDRCYVGFWFATLGLPLVLARKEDALGAGDVFTGDFSDPRKEEELRSNMERAVRNEPQIKLMIGGAFADMLRRGVFER